MTTAGTPAKQQMLHELRRLILSGEVRGGAWPPSTGRPAEQYGIDRDIAEPVVGEPRNAGLVVSQRLPRLPVGLEDPDDPWPELDHALQAAR
jgi:DNA-binding transcriptional MocR family regulator